MSFQQSRLLRSNNSITSSAQKRDAQQTEAPQNNTQPKLYENNEFNDENINKAQGKSDTLTSRNVDQLNYQNSVDKPNSSFAKVKSFSQQKRLSHTQSIEQGKASYLSREKKLPFAKTFAPNRSTQVDNSDSSKRKMLINQKGRYTFRFSKKKDNNSSEDSKGLVDLNAFWNQDPRKVKERFTRDNKMFKEYLAHALDEDRDELAKAFDSDDAANVKFRDAGKLEDKEEEDEKKGLRQDSVRNLQKKLKKRKTIFKVNFLIRLGFVLAFTVVFVFGLLISRGRFQVNKCVGYLRIYKFLIIIGSIGPVYVLAYIVSKILLLIFKLCLLPRFYWYFVVPLRHQFRMFFMIALEWICVAVLVNQWPSNTCESTPRLYSFENVKNIVYRAFLSLLLLSICNILKRLVTKVLAARDRGTHQFQRGLESLFAEFVIIVLHTPKDDQDVKQIDEMIMQWHLPLLKALEDENFREQTQVRDALQKHIELHSLKFFDDVVKKDKGEKQLNKAAQRITLKIFKNLSPKDGDLKQSINREDFVGLFPDAIVGRAYRQFDKDDSGDVSFDECLHQIEKIFNDRLNLKRSIQDSNNIYGKLENIIGFFLFVLVGLTILIIFQQNLGYIWTIFTGSAAVISLVLADPIKRFIESIIFIFLIRPFDVGDWVQIETEIFQVVDIHLLDMILKRADGQKFFYPNNKLYTVRVVNLTKSDGQIDNFYFVVDMNTDPQALDNYFDAVKAHVKRTKHDLEDLFITQIVPSTVPHKVQVQVIIQYKENMRDGIRMLGMKTRFFQFAMEELCKHNIRFTIPSTEELTQQYYGNQNQNQNQGQGRPSNTGQAFGANPPVPLRHQSQRNPSLSLI